jgi:DNA polymerase I-like protein with 3'-5' exonuclease and polymerase domains
MAIAKKGIHCVGCPLEVKGQGFVSIRPPADWTKIKLLVEGDMPSIEAVDDQTPFSGRMGHWLKRNWLENAGLNAKEVLFDNVLRCRPHAKSGSPYPKHKKKSTVRQEAEAHCAGYDVWPLATKSVPLLLISDASAQRRAGESSVSVAHGSISDVEGRMVGITFSPASVMKEPNLLPVVIRETENLLEANRRGIDVLDRPSVIKDPAPYIRGREFVVDLEWDYKGTDATTVVGIAYESRQAYSTHDVADGLRTVNQHLGDATRMVGHNVITADLPRLGGSPVSFKSDHIVDTFVLAHLIHPHLAGLGLYDLDSMVRLYKPTTRWKNEKGDILAYNGRDAAYNFGLYEGLWQDLMQTEQQHLLDKDQMLAHLTWEMEQRGIKVDSEGLKRYKVEWAARRKQIAADLPFNPGSWQQITKYFKGEGLMLDGTDYETLTRAAKKNPHPVLKHLIEYKDEGKGLDAWFSDSAIDLGRIHPRFNVTGTAVARFSSAGPNAQNIPPEFKQFILPNSDDEFIVDFDGKNLEGRTVAYNAQDSQMMEDHKHSDAHKVTASRIFEKRIDDVTKIERQIGKTVVHASNYKETAYHLAERIYGNVKRDSIRKAEILQQGYFAAYPATYEWQQKTLDAMSRGDIFIRNNFGRRRGIYAQNDHERTKRALHYYGCSDGAEVVNQRALDIRAEMGLVPLLVVHDSLVYSVPRGSDGERTVRRIREILDSPIPQMNGYVIPFGYKHGPNYGNMTEEV